MKVKAKICVSTKELLIVGCNYHTIWQSEKSMRFVLVEFNKGMAILKTRNTRRIFKTEISSLLFITTSCNISKASDLTGKKYKDIKKYINDNKLK